MRIIDNGSYTQIYCTTDSGIIRLYNSKKKFTVDLTQSQSGPTKDKIIAKYGYGNIKLPPKGDNELLAIAKWLEERRKG